MSKIATQNWNGPTGSTGSTGSTNNDFLSRLQDMSNDVTARTFNFNQTEAEKERNWSEYMSNTSHQREVDDLKRAGLNPVLSANSGANAYSGASASGSADNSAIGALASIYQTQMNNDNAFKIAQMNNSTNLQMAKINAAASNYSANMSSSASRYATEHTKTGVLTEFMNGLVGNDNGANFVGSKVGNFIKKIFK